jgi:hypothetical protein
MAKKQDERSRQVEITIRSRILSYGLTLSPAASLGSISFRTRVNGLEVGGYTEPEIR